MSDAGCIRVDRMVVVRMFCVQAEDGIRDLVRSRGLGDVYKRQMTDRSDPHRFARSTVVRLPRPGASVNSTMASFTTLSLIHI